ncbi:MAG: TIGR00153 family protein [Deltaproteobacteria bacterium]|nr:MAG: TIGR00153 family protein [Deltaproteobacteria bacterium]
MSLMGNLFGKSPIRPMQEHMRAAVACARAVLPLFEDMASGKSGKLEEHRDKINRLEHEADRIKHEIRSHLPRRLMLAVERRDLLEILDCQDTIADLAQDIAGLADQRRMTIPEGLEDPLLELVRRTIAAVEHAQGIVEELDELIETGFAGREVAIVEEKITQLSLIESETDRLAEIVHRRLFAMEGELGVGTVFWYDIVNWIAGMADEAERVGNRLRLLIAR